MAPYFLAAIPRSAVSKGCPDVAAAGTAVPSSLAGAACPSHAEQAAGLDLPAVSCTTQGVPSHCHHTSLHGAAVCNTAAGTTTSHSEGSAKHVVGLEEGLSRIAGLL